MSVGLIKNNSSSPFRLQRSIVAQGDENGAYSQGGFDPNNVEYNSDVANTVIRSTGEVIGAALASRTSEDDYKSDIKRKERLTNRKDIVEAKEKVKGISSNKKERLHRRSERISGRLKRTNERIDKYEKKKNPTLKSDIKNTYTEPTKKEENDSEPTTLNKNYYVKQ